MNILINLINSVYRFTVGSNWRDAIFGWILHLLAAFVVVRFLVGGALLFNAIYCLILLYSAARFKRWGGYFWGAIWYSPAMFALGTLLHFAIYSCFYAIHIAFDVRQFVLTPFMFFQTDYCTYLFNATFITPLVLGIYSLPPIKEFCDNMAWVMLEKK